MREKIPPLYRRNRRARNIDTQRMVGLQEWLAAEWLASLSSLLFDSVASLVSNPMIMSYSLKWSSLKSSSVFARTQVIPGSIKRYDRYSLDLGLLFRVVSSFPLRPSPLLQIRVTRTWFSTNVGKFGKEPVWRHVAGKSVPRPPAEWKRQIFFLQIRNIARKFSDSEVILKRKMWICDI